MISKMPNQDKPVFVRGLSRSGGTFLCTMLDAHPELAISYELYPNLLQLEPATTTASLVEFLSVLQAVRAIKNISLEDFPTPKYRTYFVRLERGGVTKAEAVELLESAIESALDFSEIQDCGKFVEMCCSLKMLKEGKTHWGAKMNNRIEQYIEQWPRVKCLDIVRDGRDVAASQIKLGTFGKSVEQIASAWKNTHSKFLKFQESHPRNVKVVRYEDLIYDSQNQIQKMCDFLEIAYSAKMLNYHKEKLTLFKATHISKDNVMSGINSNSVGKWKEVLSEQQAGQFIAIAGDLIEYFDY